MINPDHFVKSLKSLGVRFVTGVPDSLLKEVCASFCASFSATEHITAANEGCAIGLAIGHYLATARIPLVYAQNSGLGNMINPLLSLVDQKVYGIPMLLLIGWRGELLADEMFAQKPQMPTQIQDEPQHVKQGEITLSLLETLGIAYRVIDQHTKEINDVLEEAITEAKKRLSPVALVVRKNTFSPFLGAPTLPLQEQSLLTREAAIDCLLSSLPEDVPIISTTGMASRELFELRMRDGTGHHRDFLTVGGMGHASQIAAGIAFSLPAKKVICIDGDGAFFMHAGGLALSAKCPNLIHIVLNNEVHDSVGGQATAARSLHLEAIAQSFGYQSVVSTSSVSGIKEALFAMLCAPQSAFLEIRCKPGARANLGRPNRTPRQNKADFMAFLGG